MAKRRNFIDSIKVNGAVNEGKKEVEGAIGGCYEHYSETR